ncbi:DoxX family protein, partial [Streptomyces milbemycinicus]
AALLALAFLAAGAQKATGQAKALEQADHLHVPHTLYRLVGVLEVLGVVGVVIGLWVSWLGVAAAAGLTLMMVGAVGAHVRAKDPGKAMAPALVLALLAVAEVVLRAATA